VSTRWAAAVVTLASIAVPSAAAERPPLDVEGSPGARALAPLEAPAVGSSAVRLVWTDPAGVAVGVDTLARDEARSVLRRMGVAVSWRRGPAGEATRPGEVRVILLDRGALRGPLTPVLGATPSHFAAAPFVWVHVPGVRAVMGLSPQGLGAALDPAAARGLAVALGRVVAHEVVHALVPSVPHGTGLMSATLNRRQLVAATLPVDPEVSLAVRAALRGEPSPPRADAGALAAATAGKESE
jgi:hypothetical protein